MTVVGNLKHIGAVVGACNLAGFACTAVLETHKLTDLVGAGSFVVAAFSLSRRNGLLNLETFKNFRKSRQLLINGVVMIWGSRLASFLFGRVLHVGEDKRLKPFFRKPEEKYLDAEKSLFPLKLASFWAIQAMWGWMCMIPIALLNSKESGSQLSKGIRSNKFLRYGSLIIPFFAGLGGIIIESVADYQKYKYRNNKANDNHWCDVGLWSLSRHPNCKRSKQLPNMLNFLLIFQLKQISESLLFGGPYTLAAYQPSPSAVALSGLHRLSSCLRSSSRLECKSRFLFF